MPIVDTYLPGTPCWVDLGTTDPGAAIGVWQAGKHIGATLVTEPWSWSWNQLATRDKAGAEAFYSAVFGWSLTTHPEWGEHWAIEGREIAGIMEMGPNFPAQVPSHWQVMLMVDDADAAVAKAEELGGSAHGPVTDMPMTGRMAAIADPQGAAFGVLSFPAADEAEMSQR